MFEGMLSLQGESFNGMKIEICLCCVLGTMP